MLAFDYGADGVFYWTKYEDFLQQLLLCSSRGSFTLHRIDNKCFRSKLIDNVFQHNLCQLQSDVDLIADLVDKGRSCIDCSQSIQEDSNIWGGHRASLPESSSCKLSATCLYGS